MFGADGYIKKDARIIEALRKVYDANNLADELMGKKPRK